MSLTTTVKSIQDIMRKDVGVDGDAQRIGQLVWLLFLKVWDDREQELELIEDRFASPLIRVTWRDGGDTRTAPDLRWSAWAADPEGLTGDKLLDFANNVLFPALKGMEVGPPVAEQKRIVARVDELMGLLDRLEAAQRAREATRAASRDAALAALREADTAEEVEVAWERLAEQLHDLFTAPSDVAPLRQTILQLAVRGRLVPCTFAQERLSDLLREPLANGRSVPDGNGYPVLRLTALRGKAVDSSFRKAGAWSADEAQRFRIEAGDLLVVRGNGSRSLVARASMVEQTEEVAYPDTAIRVRSDPSKVAARYLLLAWESPATREILETKAKTTAGIWKVNQADLSDVLVPVPPLAEQHRIVAKVDALMAVLDRLEERLTRQREAHEAFAAAAVHHLEA